MIFPVPVAKSKVADSLLDDSKSSCILEKSLFHLALITSFFSKFSFANAVISLYSPEFRNRKAISAASFDNFSSQIVTQRNFE